jgi:acetolactate synthase-1/2/3 large subunit
VPTVADLVMERLADAGVTHCFVLPGGGAMHLVDALARIERVKAFPMLHEQAVGVAAEAYAQYTNGLGAALVTTGPGGTNAVTAVAAAWLDSTPCVFISGQVKTADLSGERGVRQFGFQEIDIVAVVKPITKHAVMITSADDAVAQVDEALSIARSGRPGPVWIDIPLDVQAQQVEWQPAEHEPPGVPHTQSNPAPKAREVEAVVQALGEAKRPLVLLGNGVRLAGATELAVDLFSRLGVPMALTWKALDFLPYDHPLNAGRPGSIATYASNFAIQGADVVLAIGARLDLGQLGYRHDTFVPEGIIFVVDVDPAEVGKFEFASPYLGIESDAGAFLEALDRAFVESSELDTVPWVSQIGQWQRDLPPLGEDDRDWDDGISQYTLISELSAQMTPNHLLVPGSSGACSEVVMQAFQNKAGQRVFNTEGLGPMGFGIPAAIGACVASGGRPVVSVDGDGGFAMNVQELATVAFHQLPISFFVLDNGGYGSIRTTSNNYFGGRKVGCDPESGLGLPDYARLGKAFGLMTQVVRRRSEIAEAARTAISFPGPTLTVVKIGEASHTHPRLTSQRLPDGRMATSPLDQLTPSLG